jgi:hypothetical protein
MANGKIESIEDAVAHANNKIKPYESSQYQWRADEEKWAEILKASGLDFDDDPERAESLVREIVKSVLRFHGECDRVVGEPLEGSQEKELEKHLESIGGLREAAANPDGLMNKLLRASCQVGHLAKVLTGGNPKNQRRGGHDDFLRLLEILEALESDLRWLFEEAEKKKQRVEEVAQKRLCHRLKAIHRTHERRAVVKANYPNGAPGGIYANNFVKISLECIGDVVTHSAVKTRVKGDMPDIPAKRAIVPELARHSGWFDLKKNQGDQ